MPKTVSEGFQAFLSRIEPLTSEREKAARHKESVRSCLINNFGCYDFKETGSFGNGTGVRHFSDVDYFAIIPAERITNDSAYMLRKVKAALQSTFWSTTGIEVDSPAVVIPFGNYKSEDLEVAPCTFVGMSQTSLGNFPRYEIPDGGGSWRGSSPLAHNRYVAAVDSKLNGKLKPIIKFIKAWKFVNSVPINSFYIELRAASFFNGSIVLSYDEGIYMLLKHLYEVDLASMRDPMGISGLINSSRSVSQQIMASSPLKTALTRAGKAYEARIGNKPDVAFHYWDLFFNGEFPAR
ncbi:MAG: SMODS domain-containing nucleotidyltransferase [Bacteroidia bacterium]